MAEIVSQTFEDAVALSRLKPHPDNPRKGNLSELALSIQKNGFYGGIVAQASTGFILAGNHRYQAAQGEGLKALPVFWVDCSDAEAKRILAVDNRANDLAGYDNEALARLLTDISAETGLAGSGYDQAAFDDIVRMAGDALMNAATSEHGSGSESGKSQLSAGFQYRIIVDCESEHHQAETLERFESEGFTCRPLIS